MAQIFGYARVSTREQNEARQFLALRGPHLKGVVMGAGGETSHTVILARGG